MVLRNVKRHKLPGKQGTELKPQGQERRCVVCRENRGLSQLVRFQVYDGAIVFEPKTKLAGRSCYLCARKLCADHLNKRMIVRLFSVRESDLKFEENWWQSLEARAYAEIYQQLGLARRANLVVIGQDGLKDLRRRSGGHHLNESMVMASKSELIPRYLKDTKTFVFSSPDILSKALGLHQVGLVTLPKSKFTDRIGYWSQFLTDSSNGVRGNIGNYSGNGLTIGAKSSNEAAES